MASAGNDGRNNDGGTHTYPCDYTLANVVCVAATDESAAIASFSNWGKTSVDLAAPGTNILSTYSIFTPSAGFFNAQTWPNAGWTTDGFAWANHGGYHSVTNNTATQGATQTRTAISPTIAVANTTKCQVVQYRDLQGTTDQYSYSVYVDGALKTTITSAVTGDLYRTDAFDIPNTASHNVQLRFSYQRKNGSVSDGVWFYYIGLECMTAPGSEGDINYAPLQGTSMAAPHVSGAAALLKAYEGGASVADLRAALLGTVDAISDLNPATGTHPVVTGGSERQQGDHEDRRARRPQHAGHFPAERPLRGVGQFRLLSQGHPGAGQLRVQTRWRRFCSVHIPAQLQRPDRRVPHVPGAGQGLLQQRRCHARLGHLDRQPRSPTVTTVSPMSGPMAGGTSVTVTGTGFWGTPTVTFGSASCTGVSVVSETSLTCTTAASAVALPVTVTVTNADAKSGSKASAFTYTAPAPTVTGVSPSTGPMAGGTSVTVTGTGFWGTPTVTFGGAGCTSVNRSSATSLTCTTPAAAAAGAVTVTVTNAVASRGRRPVRSPTLRPPRR